MLALLVLSKETPAMRRIDRIVVHTAGAARGGKAVHQSPDTIRWHHHAVLKWAVSGYHLYIEADGTVTRFTPDAQPSNGVRGMNSHTLHVCLSGHGDLEPMTPAQKRSLILNIEVWLIKYNLVALFTQNPMRVMGHRECNLIPGVPKTSKTCPGAKIDMAAIRKELLWNLRKTSFPMSHSHGGLPQNAET